MSFLFGTTPLRELLNIWRIKMIKTSKNKTYIKDFNPSNSKKYINPHKQFINAYVPEWLACRNEISPGAKLCYGRLCRYAGKNGQCFPKQKTLAKALGCSPRQVARYLKELKKWKLIETTRLGKRCSNRYFFVSHEWMEFIENNDE